MVEQGLPLDREGVIFKQALLKNSPSCSCSEQTGLTHHFCQTLKNYVNSSMDVAHDFLRRRINARHQC